MRWRRELTVQIERGVKQNDLIEANVEITFSKTDNNIIYPSTCADVWVSTHIIRVASIDGDLYNNTMCVTVYSVVNADELSRSKKNNQFRNQQLYSHEKTTRIKSALLIAIADFSSGHPGVHAILKNITVNRYLLVLRR